MTDLTERFLPDLLTYRLEGLNLGPDLVYPNYSGRSILNLPSSICTLLGVPEFGARPLSPDILNVLLGGRGQAKRVVFLLLDALGLQSLRRWLAEDSSIVWNRLLNEGALLPITSVVPSTTTAALVSLWTGASPALHGMPGYELWLKEYGVIANMIQHKPASFGGDGCLPGSLSCAGFSPEEFMTLPTLGPHLAAHGIKTYTMQHFALARSGLSQMFFKDVNVLSYASSAELWINISRLLESKADERMYAYVYWSDIDRLSHRYGPGNIRPPAEFDLFSRAFEKYFLNALSPAARKDTLLILSADHGQAQAYKDPHYELRNHPGLYRRLHMQPTGESRLSYLYIKPGQSEAVREYIERTWPHQFALIEPGYALSAGLFGPVERSSDGSVLNGVHPRLLDRLGDLIMISRGNAYLWTPDRDDPLEGRHGGLTADEMLVPLLGAWL